MEHLIEQTIGAEHPVEIIADGSVRSLRFGTVERQSCLDMKRPHILQLEYTKWMTTALALHPEPNHFLLCGLGGGALVHFLNHHHPEASIDVVEIEQSVIEVARDFFQLPQRENIAIHHADIADYLRRAPIKAPYDVIFVDLFNARAMAQPLFDPWFYRNLMDRLADNGVIAINLWSSKKTIFREAVQAMKDGCDDQVLQLSVNKRGNTILFAFPHAGHRQLIGKAAKEGAVTEQRYNLPIRHYLKRLRRSNKAGLLSHWFNG